MGFITNLNKSWNLMAVLKTKESQTTDCKQQLYIGSGIVEREESTRMSPARRNAMLVCPSTQRVSGQEMTFARTAETCSSRLTIPKL